MSVFLFQHEAECNDLLHEVAADFVCNALYTSEVCELSLLQYYRKLIFHAK